MGDPLSSLCLLWPYFALHHSSSSSLLLFHSRAHGSFTSHLQILAAHYSWKLSVEYNQPELAKLQREMRESQYLLGAQAKLKSDGHLRPMARKLAIAIIPLVVRFFCLLSVSCCFVGHVAGFRLVLCSRLKLQLISIASLAACIWFQVDLRTYIFSPEQNAYGFFLIANHATFSIGIIVISFGALVALLRRFYDSNLLWAYVVCGIVLAVLGGADIVLSLTFTANQLNRDQLLNPMAEGVAIASIVFVILMFLYQVCPSMSFERPALSSYLVFFSVVPSCCCLCLSSTCRQ
jgi:hypothetical protein